MKDNNYNQTNQCSYHQWVMYRTAITTKQNEPLSECYLKETVPFEASIRPFDLWTTLINLEKVAGKIYSSLLFSAPRPEGPINIYI